VLRLRTRLREGAQEAMREAAAALATARESVAAARAAQAAARGAEEAAAAGGLTGADLARYRAFEQSMALTEAALAEESVRLAQDLGRCRAALVERRREERQLERLRARADERDRLAAERVQAALLDDLSRR